jgi:hypothetical protein
MFYTNIDVHSQMMTHERVETCQSFIDLIVKALCCNIAHLLECSIINILFHIHIVCCSFLTLVDL